TVSHFGSVNVPWQPPLQLTVAPHEMPASASTLHRPAQVPLHDELHLPWQFGSFSVFLPSGPVQVPLHSPVHVDSHWPMQFAATSTVPSQVAPAVHEPSQTTLSSPGSQRSSTVPESQTFWASQRASHCFCISKSQWQAPLVTLSAKFASACASMIAVTWAAAASQAPVPSALEIASSESPLSLQVSCAPRSVAMPAHASRTAPRL